MEGRGRRRNGWIHGDAKVAGLSSWSTTGGGRRSGVSATVVATFFAWSMADPHERMGMDAGAAGGARAIPASWRDERGESVAVR